MNGLVPISPSRKNKNNYLCPVSSYPINYYSGKFFRSIREAGWSLCRNKQTWNRAVRKPIKRGGAYFENKRVEIIPDRMEKGRDVEEEEQDDVDQDVLDAGFRVEPHGQGLQ